MCDYTEVLSRYKKLRKAGTELNNALVHTLAKDVLQEGARKLGIMRGDVFVFGSEDETSVLMDYCIYNVRRNGMNALQRYLAENPPAEQSEEMFLLRAKAQARYSIFLVEKVVSGVGVQVLDIFRRDRAMVVDIGFGQTAVAGFTVATRMISLGDWSMTGGAPLPVSRRAFDEIQPRLSSLLGPKEPDWNGMDPQLEADLVAVVVRACLDNHDGSEIRYEMPHLPAAKQSVIRPLSRSTPVGRNDPCPCGSGRKYKKCCGR